MLCEKLLECFVSALEVHAPLRARSFVPVYSGIGIVGISQTVVRSWTTLIPEWM